MTGTLFALVVTVFMTTGEPQDTVVDVYPSYSTCRKAAEELKTSANCYQVEKVIHQSENQE